jgi:hypothetical protein
MDAQFGREELKRASEEYRVECLYRGKKVNSDALDNQWYSDLKDDYLAGALRNPVVVAREKERAAEAARRGKSGSAGGRHAAASAAAANTSGDGDGDDANAPLTADELSILEYADDLEPISYERVVAGVTEERSNRPYTSITGPAKRFTWEVKYR